MKESKMVKTLMTKEEKGMKVKRIIGISVCLILGVSSIGNCDSTNHSAQASQNGVNSVGHTLIAVNQATSGVAAVPFKVVGDVGQVSDDIGDTLLETAGFDEPLEVSNQTVTAGVAPDKVTN